MAMAEAGFEEPEPPIPEPYAVLLEMRRFDQMSWWLGGYGNQPWLLYEEFNACITAEEEIRHLEAVNEALKKRDGKA